MSFFTQLGLKLKEVFNKYSSLFPKEEASTGGFSAPRSRDGTRPAKLCLSCQAVWIRGPHDLCTNCELSPYVPDEVFSNYPPPFSKKRTSTRRFRAPGPRDGIKPPRLCLGCRAVWVQGPPELCNNCELSPCVPDEAFSNYPPPFAKNRTSTRGFRPPGSRDGIKPPRLCLGCRAVCVQDPHHLCTNCELSPYLLPVFQEEEEWVKEKKGEGDEGEVGEVSGWEGEYKRRAREEDTTQYNILKREFPKGIVEGFSWKD